MRHAITLLVGVFCALAACTSSSSSPSSPPSPPSPSPSSGSSSASSSSSSSGATSGSSSSSGAAVNPFDAAAAATRVVIEIDYQTGAEPYVGSTVAFGDTWKLFQTNASKLFEKTGKTVEVPTTLDKMEKLGDISGSTFDSAAVLAIAAKHRGTKTAGDVLAYYVVWIDGTYSEGGAEKKEVLGVSIGDTGVIAMFKPVIKGAGSPLLPGSEAAVEQTVLVHEFGHAVGLVNTGIPLASPHQDTAHGAHCSNEKCVMFWTVDGTGAALDYVKKNVTGTSLVLFADDCLADVRAAAGKK